MPYPLRQYREIDRAIAAASRRIDSMTDRRIYPQIAVKKHFRWCPTFTTQPDRLWLGDEYLQSFTSVKSDGTTIDLTKVIALPVNTGPPYNRIELTGLTFTKSEAEAVSVEIQGDWGSTLETIKVGGSPGAVTASATTMFISDSSRVSPGTVLKVGAEWILVEDQKYRTVTETVVDALADRTADDQIVVTDASGFYAGEHIAIGGETVCIEDTYDNTLIVTRAVRGSKLADHAAGASIRKQDEYTITRAALGSQAASIAADDPVYVWQPPATVKELAIAETLQAMQHQGNAYLSSFGGTDSSSSKSKKLNSSPLGDLRDRVRHEFRTPARIGAV